MSAGDEERREGQGWGGRRRGEMGKRGRKRERRGKDEVEDTHTQEEREGKRR